MKLVFRRCKISVFCSWNGLRGLSVSENEHRTAGRKLPYSCAVCITFTTRQCYKARAWLLLCHLLEWNCFICSAACQLEDKELTCCMGSNRQKTKFGKC
jgi:hypothetical protein